VADISEKIHAEILKHYLVDDYSWGNYEPASQTEETVVIGCLAKCLYKKEESDQILKGAMPSQGDQDTPDKCDTFIRNLRITYDNDYGIRIQEPRNKFKTFSHDSLGFRDEQTKEWKTLLRILRESDHTYSLGPVHQHVEDNRIRQRAYEAKRKRLQGINKKLIRFFNKEYQMKIPHNYKLYEPCKDGRQGTFKFKFQIEENRPGLTKASQYEDYNKDQLIAEIENLVKRYRNEMAAGNESLAEETTFKLNEAFTKAKEAGWMTEEELTKMVKPDTHKEDIRYDPYENIEDRDPDY
jgi:hypothetical protein